MDGPLVRFLLLNFGQLHVLISCTETDGSRDSVLDIPPLTAGLGPQFCISVLPCVSQPLGHSWSLTFITPPSLWKFCKTPRSVDFPPFSTTGEIPALWASPWEPGSTPALWDDVFPLLREPMPREILLTCRHTVRPSVRPLLTRSEKKILAQRAALGEWPGASCLRVSDTPLRTQAPEPLKTLFLIILSELAQAPRTLIVMTPVHGLDLWEGKPSPACAWAVWLWSMLGS